MARCLAAVLALILCIASPALALSPAARPGNDSETDRLINEHLEKLKKRYQETQKEKPDATLTEDQPSAVQDKSNNRFRITPEQEAYYRYLRDVVTSNWMIPKELASEKLTCNINITIDPDGSVRDVQIMKSSGIDDFDDSVLQAVKRSSPLRPLSPVFGDQAVKVIFNFNPNHSSRSNQARDAQ